MNDDPHLPRKTLTRERNNNINKKKQQRNKERIENVTN